jgi:hypothetical protein
MFHNLGERLGGCLPANANQGSPAAVISHGFYCQFRLLDRECGLNFAQVARGLNLDEKAMAKWARARNYTRPANRLRKSKLDTYKDHSAHCHPNVPAAPAEEG